MKYSKIHSFFSLLFVAVLMVACSQKEKHAASDTADSQAVAMKEEVNDPHTYAKPEEAVIKHLDWDAKVDFEQKIIKGVARLTIQTAEDAKELILDTKELTIEKVTLGKDEKQVDFELADAEKYMGSKLTIPIEPTTEQVNVYYQTSPHAEALQWLKPVQTAGKKHPFLFTQSQAILARSWIPLQDSPGIRFTYHANVQVPEDLIALMSASNPQERNKEGKYEFKMPQPIPAYLMALSVGDVVFKPIGDRTGVYAERSVINEAAYEFGNVDDMLEAAENLYGPYRWGRYDLIVLPPSFPFGGMENPRLTFATPTILAGDRSLTSLVAHELAHSWSGNLVTNATWDDFWLNEGFTVYFENRIMEAVNGASYANMLAELAEQDLREEVKSMQSGEHPEDTKLKLDLKGRNPDDGVTTIAYDKGFFFLKALENKVGRDKWDAFLKTYFNENAFKTITTEQFITYTKKNLFEKNNIAVEDDFFDKWIYSEGLPEDFPSVESDRFEMVDAELEKWKSGTPAAQLSTKEWTTHEWLHFLRNLPKEMNNKQMTDLDKAFGFTKSGNSEIQAAWFIPVIDNDYKMAYPAIEEFLVRVGRRKFLVPIYKEMKETGKQEMAMRIYKKARPNYHYVSVATLDEMLGYEKDNA